MSIEKILTPADDSSKINDHGVLNTKEKIRSDFLEILGSEKFADNYVKLQTLDIEKEIADLNKKIDIATERKLKESVEVAACAVLGVASVDEGRKRGKEWGLALKSVQENLVRSGITVELDGGTQVIPYKEWLEATGRKVKDEFFKDKDTAEKALADAREQSLKKFDNIKNSFMKALDDSIFQEAIGGWREAPSLNSSIKHAGLVHFIEYRSDLSKAGRFSYIPEELSPDGFVKYTERLSSLIKNPKSEQILEAVHLKDENNRERLLIMTRDKQFVSAFRDSDKEEWGIITHIPDVQSSQWEKTKKVMRDAESQTKYHNKLSGKIEEIPV